MSLVMLLSVIIPIAYLLLISKDLSAHAKLIIHNSGVETSPFFIKSSPINSPPVTKNDMDVIYELKISNTDVQLKETKMLLLTSSLFVIFISSLPFIAEIIPFSLTLTEMGVIDGTSRFSSYFVPLIPLFFFFSDFFIRADLFAFIAGLQDADDKDKSLINSLMKISSPDRQERKNKAQSYLNAVSNQNRSLTKAEVIDLFEFLTENDSVKIYKPVFLA